MRKFFKFEFILVYSFILLFVLANIYINKFRVPASYLNFYIFNKFVLLPTFNDPKDKIVIKIFKKEFNNRKIIPIDCSELIWGFGAIHCLTQQEPK